jgi:lipid-binding SYLF domain-containing protein
MNERGADSILRSGVKLAGEISAVAGPKGRDAQVATDAYMGAEILSYSRSRGLFAGISVAGSTLRSDDDGNERIYGRKISPRDIVLDNKVAIPAPGRHLVHVLQKNAPRNESTQSSTP